MNETACTAAREILKEALRRSAGKPVALLVGEASSTDTDPVKLHMDGNADCCIEIPGEAVYYSSAIDGKRIRLLIDRNAKLVVTRKDMVRAGDLVSGEPCIGVSELINLQKIRGWISKGLTVIGETAECLNQRKEFDELVEVRDSLGKGTADQQMKHWFDTELLRMLVDMQDCPSWIQP